MTYVCKSLKLKLVKGIVNLMKYAHRCGDIVKMDHEQIVRMWASSVGEHMKKENLCHTDFLSFLSHYLLNQELCCIVIFFWYSCDRMRHSPPDTQATIGVTGPIC